jgi:hypothetical protein
MVGTLSKIALHAIAAPRNEKIEKGRSDAPFDIEHQA